MASAFDYLRDPAEIYRRSFELIDEAVDLSVLPGDMRGVASRLVHACGMPDIIDDLVFSDGAATIGQAALENGAPILVDAEMVGAGIIRKRLSRHNDIICTLNDTGVPALAKTLATTRSAAALELWREHMNGSVIAIGNAPTALFRLLELLDEGWPKPALVLGFAVGFVGAAESKQALVEMAPGLDVPFIALRGKRGGSALAASAVNALAMDEQA
ncbi:MAG: precorrin-8X methylmutase [Rhodospirillaceae bacterium]|nr:precorrin-8X methylmutase [Alphaproteobacteria bacterium]MBT4463143.1 precorrin-8X methylmutase [Rhodospirillaceae bacterium]MBT5308290.1 precorrin-8X methylmutase [Rhodospirillaceae bacterium]MBT6406332.1 precorrin-8X methylmutase [Rhodospirillaceae bacterium]MBT7356325.1 precorrin-8X methylmutase [Rhodospirillaceae bacterium]